MSSNSSIKVCFCCRLQMFWIVKLRANLPTRAFRRRIHTSTTTFIPAADVGVCLMFLDNCACSWMSSVRALMPESTVRDFLRDLEAERSDEANSAGDSW